jgi:hypothetical protein
MRVYLRNALLALLASLSLWLSAELLFLNSVILPAMRGALTAAYQGQASRLINLVLVRLAVDPYDTPLWLLQDRLTYAYEAMKIPLLVLVVGATVYLWMSTRPRQAGVALHSWAQRLTYLVSCLLLLSFLVNVQLGTYSRFMADDYCFAAAAATKGVVGATVYWYLTLISRFSTNLLLSLQGALGPALAPTYTAAILLIWMGVMTFAVLQFLASRQWRTRFVLSCLLSAAVVFTTLQTSIDLPQSLYWWSQMGNMLPPLVLLAASVGLLRRRLSPQWPAAPGWGWWLAAGALSFIAGGFSEAFTALQVSTWGLVLGACVICDGFRFRNKLPAHVGPLLLGSLAALAAHVAAPGFGGRLADVRANPSFMGTLGGAWAGTIEWLRWALVSWQPLFSLLALLLLSGLVSGGFFGADVRIMERSNPRWRDVILLAMSTLVLLYSCFVPAGFALGRAPPGRHLAIPAFVLACAVACEGAIIGRLLLRSEQSRTRSIVRLAGTLVLALYVVTTSQAVYGQLRLLRPFARYASAWDANNALIRAALAEGADHVEIRAMPGNWWGVEGREIGPDPSFWVNQCASQYYGIEITAAPEGAP